MIGMDHEEIMANTRQICSQTLASRLGDEAVKSDTHMSLLSEAMQAIIDLDAEVVRLKDLLRDHTPKAFRAGWEQSQTEVGRDYAACLYTAQTLRNLGL